MDRLKRILLHTTALCIGLAIPLTVISHSAEASCSNYAPTTGTVVTCSGSSTTPITAGSSISNITVDVEDGASLSTSNITIKLSGSGNTINLYGDSVVSSSATAIALGNSSATGNAVVLNDNSAVTASLYAITFQGSLGEILLNNSSSLRTSGSSSAIIIDGNGNAIELNGTSSIVTTGSTNAHGIWLATGSNSVSIGSGALIDAKGSAIKGSISSDTIKNYGTLISGLGTTIKAELTASQRYAADSVVYRPHMKIGVLEDIMPGNEVEGYFLDSGTPFEMPLTKGKRCRALAGIGLEARFAGGPRRHCPMRQKREATVLPMRSWPR